MKSMEKSVLAHLRKLLSASKKADKDWYLALLDGEAQRAYESERLKAVLAMLKALYVSRYQKRIAALKQEIAELKSREDYSASDYRAVLEKNAEIARETNALNGYRCFFSEPYFARMDVTDEKEGYNSYYIGKKGDVNLEIVDWRAPLAVRYYQKSRVGFSINEYNYRVVLRRALSVKNGKLIDFRNEYLSVKDTLTPEEIAGRDEEILFDPYLRSIIMSRKDDVKVRDIIQTIQEQQFDVINRPERESFVLQGCAGSGKTMILLHRLSYLMYNNESLRPRDVLVITPSDSFNAFIDELSRVLELKKVLTVTIQEYYFAALKNEGIDLKAKMGSERESEEYLAYLYSEKFPSDAEKKIGKLYGDLYGLFTAEECRGVTAQILADCIARQERYLRIKNASVRVRRAVLGEMKDKGEGFYFTKPFRSLMSAFTEAEDFLRFVLNEAERTPDYFFRLFIGFCRAAKQIVSSADRVFTQAEEDLDSLAETVSREISDLKRYRRKIGDEEVLTYAERIARRGELLAEITRIRGEVVGMREGCDLFSDLYEIVRHTKSCSDLLRCENPVDIARWLYREAIQQHKKKYGMKGIYPSDGYALSYILTAAGRKLTPRYGLVFVDEGQDVSRSEYALLKRIHADAAFNVFGDLDQNITPWRGLKSWDGICETKYELNRNYRNTNEIVEFVKSELGADMSPIGLHGEAVARLPLQKLASFFRGRQGLKAVIVREEYLSLFEKRGYGRADSGISKTKINVLTVYESKGLEFSSVAVYDRGMTDNEKYIAYTRALSALAVLE